MKLDLSVGDKVRVYFYPPATTRSFVEGIVERTDFRTMDGRCFSLRTTRDVILGRDLPSNRTHPYIALYEGKDDFEGRIEILERAVQPEPVSPVGPESAAEAEQAQEAVTAVAEEDQVVELQRPPRIRGWVRLLRRAA